MKEHALFYTIGLVLLFFIAAAIGFAIWGTNVWVNLANFLGGLFGPLATILGFVFLASAVRKETKNRAFDRAINIMEKSETQIDRILELPLWITFSSTPLILNEKLVEALRLTSDQKIEKIYYDEKQTRSTNIIKEMLRLLSYLGIIIDTLKKTRNNKEELLLVAAYYKSQYENLASYLCRSMYYFSTKLVKFIAQSNPLKLNGQRIESVRSFFEIE